MIEEGPARKMPSRRRGSDRWWAERMTQEAFSGFSASNEDLDPEDKEAMTQAFEGMVKRIRRTSGVK